ncbi:MAG: IMP dehydrogenase [bacterium]|jgi:IMP dehydrogenase
MYKDGKLVKIFRGMAGLGANIAKNQRTGGEETNATKYNAEGVEGYIPYAGPLKDVLH